MTTNHGALRKEAGIPSPVKWLGGGAAVGGALGASGKRKNRRERALGALGGALTGAGLGAVGLYGKTLGKGFKEMVEESVRGGPGPVNWRTGFRNHKVDVSGMSKKDWKKVKRRTQAKYHPDRYATESTDIRNRATEDFKDFMQHADNFEKSDTFRKMAFLFNRLSTEKTDKALRNPKDRKVYMSANNQVRGRGAQRLAAGSAAAATVLGVNELQKLFRGKLTPVPGVSKKLIRGNAGVFGGMSLLAAGSQIRKLNRQWSGNDRMKALRSKVTAGEELSRKDITLAKQTLRGAAKETEGGAAAGVAGAVSGAALAGTALAMFLKPAPFIARGGPFMRTVAGAMDAPTLAAVGVGSAAAIRTGIDGYKNSEKYQKLLNKTKV